MYVVILANTTQEAMAHAKKAGLQRGSFRYALKASSIRKLRVAEVHVLPGFAKRKDRHSILAELRYSKAKFVDIDPEEPSGEETGTPEPSEDAAPPVEAPAALTEAAPDVPVKRKRAAPKPKLSKAEIAELEAQLEPEGWSPPETLAAEQVVKLAAQPEGSVATSVFF